MRSLTTTAKEIGGSMSKFTGLFSKRASFKRKQLACGVAAVLALGVVNAQAEENSDEEADDVEEIVVTGSRLRNVNPTSPLTVITSEDIKKLGINSVEGIIRSLPQNFANQTPTSAIDNSGSVGSLGTATANLRGLGADATLILVNGRRTASSPAFNGSVVNLNTIPFSAIERVEVLTDGASAIYGSDAVAGVINFILRKGYDAEEKTAIRIEHGRNGGDSVSIEQTFGMSWESGSLSGNLRFEEKDAVLNEKTGFVTNDLRPLGGADGRTTSYGIPGILSIPNPVFWWMSTPVGALDPSRDPIAPVTSIDEFSMDNVVPYDSVPKNASDERETISVFLNAEQELTDSISVYADMTYSKTDSVAELRVPVGRNLVVPTTNAFNSTGQDLNIGYAFDREVAAGILPRHTNETENEKIGLSVGFSADMPFSNWKMDGYINYSQEDSYTRSFDGLIDDEVALALADSNPNTALNLFGDGSQNPDTLANIFGASTHIYSRPDTQSNDTTQWQLTANGDLFELPAGPVSMVLGVDGRNDSQLIKGYVATTLYSANPERDVLSVLSEVNLPVIGEEQGVWGVHSFDVRVAARWEEYSIEGPFNGVNSEKTFTNTSPTFGLSWFITPEFKLRGTVGESFTAPRLTQLFGQPVEPYFVHWISGRLAAGGVTHDPVTGAPIVEVPFQPTGNPDLDPETSDTTSFGFDWTPEGVLDGLKVQATYSKIETVDVIGSAMSLIFENPERYLELGRST